MIHADVFEHLIKQRYPDALVRPFGATVEVRVTIDLWRQSDSGWLNQIMNDTDCTLGGVFGLSDRRGDGRDCF